LFVTVLPMWRVKYSANKFCNKSPLFYLQWLTRRRKCPLEPITSVTVSLQRMYCHKHHAATCYKFCHSYRSPTTTIALPTSSGFRDTSHVHKNRFTKTIHLSVVPLNCNKYCITITIRLLDIVSVNFSWLPISTIGSPIHLISDDLAPVFHLVQSFRHTSNSTRWCRCHVVFSTLVLHKFSQLLCTHVFLLQYPVIVYLQTLALTKCESLYNR